MSHRRTRPARLASCILIGLLCAGLLASFGCRRDDATSSPARRPIIVVSIDTLRSDRLPAYGYDGVETPALDALREDSILFERAYAHVPLTLPSHASILTGLLPPEHGVRDNAGYRLTEDAGTDGAGAAGLGGLRHRRRRLGLRACAPRPASPAASTTTTTGRPDRRRDAPVGEIQRPATRPWRRGPASGSTGWRRAAVLPLPPHLRAPQAVRARRRPGGPLRRAVRRRGGLRRTP